MIYLIYKTDKNHSYSSRDVIAIAKTMNRAIGLVKRHAKEKEGKEIDADQFFNLINIKQTQGYAGDGEYVIDPCETNKLY